MRRKNRGTAYILSLIAIVILTAVVTGFSTRLTAHVQTETARLDRRSGELAIQAGIARAMATLAEANLNTLDLTEEWYTIGQGGVTEFQVGETNVRFEIIDSTRFVNLNTANEEQLQRLNLTEEQVAALLDWREEQLQPRLEGAKDEYYNTLETPYNTRLRRLESLSELFLIRDFTPFSILNPPTTINSNVISSGSIEDQVPLIEVAVVDSTSPNTRADGTQRVNLNVAQLPQLVQAGISNQAAQLILQRRNQGQFTSYSQVFAINGLNVQDARTLLNVATITNETTLSGKINLNTAPESVLRTIPNLQEDQVQSIINQQGNFDELGDLADIPGFSTNALQQVADFFTIGCQTFIVRLQASKGTTKSYREAFITVQNGTPRLVKQAQPLPRDPLTAWTWEADATTTTVLMENPNE
jgi:general secretion pathway protein K